MIMAKLIIMNILLKKIIIVSVA